MKITEFLRVEMPKYLDIHPVYGEIAEWIFISELSGKTAFVNANFTSLRERAALGIPCCSTIDEEKKNNILSLFEWGSCRHRQKYHNEDHQIRIDKLYTNPEVQRMAAMLPEPEDWWSP